MRRSPVDTTIGFTQILRGGTYVETPDELDRLLEASHPELA